MHEFFNLDNIHGVKNRHGLTYHFKTDGQQIQVHTKRKKSIDAESAAAATAAGSSAKKQPKTNKRINGMNVGLNKYSDDRGNVSSATAAESGSSKKKRKTNKRKREEDPEETKHTNDEGEQHKLLRDKWNMFIQEPPSKNGIGRKTVISNDPGHSYIMTATRHEVEETDGNVKRLPMDMVNHYPRAKIARPSYQPNTMSKRSLQREAKQKEAKQPVYQLSNGAYHHSIGTKALRQWHMKERTINGLGKMDALLSETTRNTFDNNEYCAYIKIVLETKWWNLLWHHQSKPIYRKKRFTQLQSKARAFAQIARDLACGDGVIRAYSDCIVLWGNGRFRSHVKEHE